MSVVLRSRNEIVTWRPLTKDGVAVPANQAVPRQADQLIGVGETYDFEYDAPAAREDLWIELRATDGRHHLQGKAIVK